MADPTDFNVEGRDRARSRLKAACLLLLRPMLRVMPGGKA